MVPSADLVSLLGYCQVCRQFWGVNELKKKRLPDLQHINTVNNFSLQALIPHSLCSFTSLSLSLLPISSLSSLTYLNSHYLNLNLLFHGGLGHNDALHIGWARRFGSRYTSMLTMHGAHGAHLYEVLQKENMEGA